VWETKFHTHVNHQKYTCVYIFPRIRSISTGQCLPFVCVWRSAVAGVSNRQSCTTKQGRCSSCGGGMCWKSPGMKHKRLTGDS
jgi:hypothetical protein